MYNRRLIQAAVPRPTSGYIIYFYRPILQSTHQLLILPGSVKVSPNSKVLTVLRKNMRGDARAQDVPSADVVRVRVPDSRLEPRTRGAAVNFIEWHRISADSQRAQLVFGTIDEANEFET
jgi:hypothetical protein